LLRPKAETDFVATLHQHVLALGGTEDWTLEILVAWLDHHIDHQDIPAGESAEFCEKSFVASWQNTASPTSGRWR
jgi:type III restriction enzyme